MKKKHTATAPNQIVGTVYETRHWSSPPRDSWQSVMDIQWENGARTTDFPMIVLAKPGDRFEFTISPV